MIPASQKFPLRTDFLRFRARAQKILSPHVAVYYALHTGHSRLAVVVPKKVSKLATTRNWLKRLTYDALYPHLKDAKLDVVVMYKPLPLSKNPKNKATIIGEIRNLKLQITNNTDILDL